jgi:Ca2+-binding RTX toxin-like protein
MTTTVTITADTTSIIDANTSDTNYIIAQGVDVTPIGGFAIDATSDAANRSFTINGHLAGNTGIRVGNDYTQPSDIHITVGASGLIDSVYDGIDSRGNDAVIVNHGDIESQRGITGGGTGMTITNTGTIHSGAAGIDIAGYDLTVQNSGDISSDGVGVSINSQPGAKATFINTGTVSGALYGMFGSHGADSVINSGSITGDVLLYADSDSYDGKGGIVHGLVDGGEGNDVLKGGGHVDHLAGDTGHDVLTGRGGADVFIFSTTSDKDTVTDFHATGSDHDRIDLSAMAGFNSFGDLSGHMNQSGSDVVLNFGHGDVLTLQHVDIHDLTTDDFLF